jgi:PAS domain S-box-containing protein
MASTRDDAASDLEHQSGPRILGLLSGDILRALTQQGASEPFLQAVARAITERLEATACQFWLARGSPPEPALRVVVGECALSSFLEANLSGEDSPLLDVLREIAPRVVNDPADNPRLAWLTWPADDAGKGLAVVPLVDDGDPLGVMALIRPTPFADAELAGLVEIAGLVGPCVGHWSAIEHLKASEERFDLAIRGSSAGLWDWDIPSGRVYYAPRFKELLGYTEQEPARDFAWFESRLHPHDRERVLAAVRDHLDGHAPYALDYRLRTARGPYRWFHARGQTLRDEAGRPTRMAGSIADITDRKATEQRFRAFLESSPDAMVIADQEGRILLVNAQTERLFGYRREELLGEPVEILVPEALREKHEHERLGYQQAPRVRLMGSEAGLTGRRRDGVAFPVEISLGPLETDEGLIVCAAIRDISERRHLIDALRESESMYRLLAENATDLISRHAPDGVYLYASPASLSLLGYEPSELLGRSAYDFIHPGDCDSVRAAHASLLDEDEVRVITFRVRRKDGSLVWFESGARAIRQPHTGKIVEIECVSRNIDDRRRIEDELRDREEQTRSVVDHVADGIITLNDQGVIQSLNPAAERIFQVRAPALVGQGLAVLIPGLAGCAGGPADAGGAPASLHGLLGSRCEAAGRRGDGRLFPIDLTLCAFEHRHERMLTAVVRYISDQKQARQRLAAEHGVAQVLAESTSIRQAAPRLIEAISRSLSWCVGAYWTLDRERELLRLSDFWHGGRGAMCDFEAACRRSALGPGACLAGRVWESGEIRWIADLSADPEFVRREAAAASRLRWGIGLPVRSREGVVGVMEFFCSESEPAEENLLAMFESICDQVGRFLDLRQADRYVFEKQKEMELGREIQSRLFPRSIPRPAGFDIAGASRPAQETGGDYFDVINLGDEELLIAVGDVSGHGVGAALIMAELRAYLRALTLPGMNLDEVLASINLRMIEDIGEDHFVTLFLAVLDPATRRLTYASAGHSRGFLFDAQGDVRLVLHSTDIALGIDARWPFRPGPTLTMEPGELLLLATDGIAEARSPAGEFLGEDGMIRAVRRCRHLHCGEIITALIEQARVFCRDVQLDDMTAVAIKVE